VVNLPARGSAAGLAALLAGGAVAFAGAAAHAESSSVAFRFADDRIIESSGLAVSARHDGVSYTHNDSGGGPVVYAVGADGATKAALTLRGAPDRDWEAIAPGRDPQGRPAVWVGDIGDNITGWTDIRIMRFTEPETLKDADVPFTVFRFKYADGRSRNAEALLADPRTGRLYVVSKRTSGDAAVYRAPEKLSTVGFNLLRKVADAPAEVTDAAYTKDGAHAVLRGYFYAKVVDRDWKVVDSMTPPLQMQGESVAAGADGRSMLFGSEGLESAVWRVPLPQTLGGAGEDVTATPSPTSTKKAEKKKATSRPKPPKATASPAPSGTSQGLPGVDGKMIAGLAALGLGALILVLAVRRG
jgi:hypothetical protein